MNRFTLFILRQICKKVVEQGPHRNNIITYYRTLREAAGKEFTEDSKPTLDAFLRECHDQAQGELQQSTPHQDLIFEPSARWHEGIGQWVLTLEPQVKPYIYVLRADGCKHYAAVAQLYLEKPDKR